ncbi:C-terminal of NADH-ubiquinone oxidoreductase 21 kDa subunit-domain-containing protein [Phyllosticta citricarpa]|uniref:C-terminal of NADH-ubiquinone oxidoreductase 21 kDa subunit-domain-containing protein n=1 Tax=Phyllosticta citricarpa TaxID=55181 RepID=A0ABR1LR86_9PEZI
MAPSEVEYRERPVVPAKKLDTDYPLIDSDPHFTRVVRYARPSDYAVGAAHVAAGPALLLLMERVSPSYVGRRGFAPIMRATCFISLAAGFLKLYTRSTCAELPIPLARWFKILIGYLVRFHGVTENRREIDMDMREMVDKVKKGEPLYGVPTMTEHLQGVAARNSRYSVTFLPFLPWGNFFNHNHHGVDTAKYYQQAERELAAEEAAKTN